MKQSIHVRIRFVAVTMKMKNKLGRLPHGDFFSQKLIRECNSVEGIAEKTDKINSKYWLKISKPNAFTQEA